MLTAPSPGLALGGCPEKALFIHVCVCLSVSDLLCGLVPAPGTECSSFPSTQAAAITSFLPEEFVFLPTLQIAQTF